MSKEKVDALLRIMPYGKENAVHNEVLSRQLEISRKGVKDLVREARQQGIPIVSSTCGYWISGDKEELQDFVNRMDKQAKKHFISVRAIKRTLNNTEGQISLSGALEGITEGARCE